MSFLYRPTPIVLLGGKTVGSDHVPLRRLPAGVMNGYTPNLSSPRLNAIGRRTMRGNPWLVASGTMAGFLGDDSVDTGSDLPDDFFAGLSESPSLPTDTFDLPTNFFTGATESPIIPASTASLTTPPPGITSNPDTIYSPGTIVAATPGPVAPTSQGAVATAAAAASSGASSLLTSIANLFKPTTTVRPMTAAQPGVYTSGVTSPAVLSTAGITTWLNSASLVAGVPNSTVVFGGLAALILFSALSKGRR